MGIEGDEIEELEQTIENLKRNIRGLKIIGNDIGVQK
jgi:hypothetical protein